MNENDPVTIREFEFRLKALRDEFLALAAAHYSEHAGLKLALDVQAAESTRRLDILNEAHERADAVRERYVEKPTLVLELARLESEIKTIGATIPPALEVSRLATGAANLEGRITAVERQQGQWSGRGSGVQLSWAVFLGLATLIVALIGVIVIVGNVVRP